MGTITGFYGYVLFHIFIPPETNNNLNFELTKKINRLLYTLNECSIWKS